jgi:hypothetical protein
MTSIQEPFGLILTSTYDALDNRTQVQDSFGGTLTSVYDSLNRLSTREFGGTGQTPLRMDLTYTAQDYIATETRYSDLAGTNKIGSTTMVHSGGATTKEMKTAFSLLIMVLPKPRQGGERCAIFSSQTRLLTGLF